MPVITTPVCAFGEKVHDFSLPDCYGNLVDLSTIYGTNGLLIMFICNHCPYVQAILPELVATTKVLKQAGINTVAIMSNDWLSYPDDSPEKMRVTATSFGFDFPYLVDESQLIAQKYGAVCTPDFFGYNNLHELQYRGRFDARGRQFGLERAGEVTQNELEQAMLLIAKTGNGPAEQRASMGCSIKWK